MRSAEELYRACEAVNEADLSPLYVAYTRARDRLLVSSGDIPVGVSGRPGRARFGEGIIGSA